MLPLRSLANLCTFLALDLPLFSAGKYINTTIVIVSNNDLNPSNTNRASALFLKSSMTCEEAQQSCGDLQESLLPAPISTGLTAENLTTALTSERHGAALDLNQNIWIAGSGGCTVFTVGTSHTYETDTDTSPDLSSRYPALCTNSAPLTRSNVTSYDTSRQIEVSTPSAGVLRGFRDKFSFRFLGIKFAKSPAGAGRFKPPIALQVSRDTVRDALEYGPRCAQPPNVDNGHMVWTEEDCLQLNVYSPIVVLGGQAEQSTSKLPVMFFIHGGGLNHGDSGPFPYNMTTSGYVGPSTSNIFDGTNLVSYGGVVLVTINYRLTTLGWFNASNAALKDALLALQWVQDNVEAFGGDPTRVLLYGESAGGFMTRYLLGTNPKYTEGLFSAAILESDYGTSNPFSSPNVALNTSLQLAKHVGCASNSSTSLTGSDVECVANVSAGSLAIASFNLGIAWTVVVDGDYVLNDIAGSIMDGICARVPTIWATNQCEYCYFLPATLAPDSPPSSFISELPNYFNETQIQRILNQPELYPYETASSSNGISGAVLQLAQLLTDWFIRCPDTNLASLEANTTNPGNAYKILFAVGLGSTITPNPATCLGQVCHADELYLVFATAETDNLYQPLTDFQVAATQETIKRWTSLAWTGDPNYEGAAVQWPPYTGDNEFVLGSTGSIQPYRVDQCDFIRTQLGLVYGDGTY
ncbi:alpha beta-hydrolase [Suillus clintonianus]|uniref:alpha beta-hydrolase n=1 Tax=Suillus clintonianus TaxID=1904413 RepID=UPI001B882842|nr:alpha beta-hydrolase [Suillus clintonianus]KAG2146243.1 alpha beta-hydrolase [Suillus clintonianus]